MAHIADPAFLKMAAAATAAGLPAPAGPVPLIANPGYGALDNMGIAFFVLAVILLVAKYGRGFLANIAVLIGIIAGTALSFALGKADISRGLRVNGLGTLIGGIFHTFPYTSFSQNVGLVGVTGVRSRWVCVAAGLILLVMGVIPKIAQTAEAVPAWKRHRSRRAIIVMAASEAPPRAVKNGACRMLLSQAAESSAPRNCAPRPWPGIARHRPGATARPDRRCPAPTGPRCRC